MQLHEQIDETARAFVAARRAATALSDYPGQIPDTLDAAYAIQQAAIALSGAAVAGWKVGRIWPPLEQQYGANRLAGPIFAHEIANGDDAAGHVFMDGFGAAEAEFVFRLADTIPDDVSALSIEQTADLVAAVHIGIEIASSPFAGINDHGPAVTISDFGNNNGLIVGAAITDWRTANFADWPVALFIDDAQVGEGKASAFPDGPLGAVRFLLQNLADRGVAATPGLWISSGAVTGVHRVAPGQRVRAQFGPDHSMACAIYAASHTQAA